MSSAIVPRTDLSNNLGTTSKRWNEVHTNTVFAENLSGGVKTEVDSKATKTELARVEGEIAGSAAPRYYEEDESFSGEKLVISTPGILWLNINNQGYKLSSKVTMDISDSSKWDTKASAWAAGTAYAVGDYVTGTDAAYMYKCKTAGTSSTLTPTWPTTVGLTYNDGSVVWECVLNYTAAANRAGKDFYIYAQSTGTLAPAFTISVNSTVPENGNATTTRKVGGFHCLCADAGTNISDNSNVHPLSGYVAGDILPASVWDLKHRPISDPEGMAYHEGLNLWIDIYLSSWTGSFNTDLSTDTIQLVSKFGGVTADGTSSEKWHALKFDQQYGRQKKRLLWRREFMASSIGSNQATAIKGAADVNTTGGHVDTAGRRMISNIGLEDCCGFLDQWGNDVGSTGASDWGNDYDANDHYVKGSAYNAGSVRVLLGGNWSNSSYCGSRCAYWSYGCLALGASIGARGASEPLGR